MARHIYKEGQWKKELEPGLYTAVITKDDGTLANVVKDPEYSIDADYYAQADGAYIQFATKQDLLKMRIVLADVLRSPELTGAARCQLEWWSSELGKATRWR